MLDSASLRGKLFPAVPVPFDAQGVIADEAQVDYAEWMARQPIGGVAVWAHTGRGLNISPTQRELVLRRWREALGEEHRIICGVGAQVAAGKDDANYLAEAIAMAQHAQLMQADALLCFPPTQFRGAVDAEEKIFEYHRRLAEIGCPLILFYLYEAAGGVNYSFPLLERLLLIPGVIGIKMATLDSVMTFQDVSRWMGERFPEKTLITGEDRFLGYSLLRGAQSALIGMGAACTRAQYDLIQAVERKDGAYFFQLCQWVDELAEHTFIAPMEGYIQRMLWALVHRGVIDRSAAYDPWGPKLPEEEFVALGKLLQRYHYD